MNPNAESRQSGTRARVSGFTLIEVLAALVIVSLGMLGVIEAVSQTVSNTTYLKDKTLAHWIAMNQLAQVRLSGRVPEIKKTDGQLEYAGQRWRWIMTVTQTPVASMRRIDINVRRDGTPERSSLSAITGFYGAALERPGNVANANSWGPTPGMGPNPNGNPGDPSSPAPRTPADPAPVPDEPVDTPTEPPPEPEPGTDPEPR
jgi:general secretion pathway protein I